MSFFATSSFDATKVDPAAVREAIPAGTYKVLIKAAVEKPTKKIGGLGLSLEYKVADEGPAKGRSVFHWINLKNANPTAAEIGQRELSSLCRATGVLRPKAAGEFVGRMLTIKVGVEKDDKQKLVNFIEEIVLPPAGQTTAPAAAPAQVATAPVAATAPVTGGAATTLADESAPWG
jgi:hypothetical protein